MKLQMVGNCPDCGAPVWQTDWGIEAEEKATWFPWDKTCSNKGLEAHTEWARQ